LARHEVESTKSIVGLLDGHHESDTFLSLLGWKDPIVSHRGREHIESGASAEVKPTAESGF
jgi:hypothetical protein